MQEKEYLVNTSSFQRYDLEIQNILVMLFSCSSYITVHLYDSKITESVGSGQDYKSCSQTQMTTLWHLPVLRSVYFCMSKKENINLITGKLVRLQLQSNWGELYIYLNSQAYTQNSRFPHNFHVIYALLSRKIERMATHRGISL